MTPSDPNGRQVPDPTAANSSAGTAPSATVDRTTADRAAADRAGSALPEADEATRLVGAPEAARRDGAGDPAGPAEASAAPGGAASAAARGAAEPRRSRFGFLELDAWIDTSIWRAGRGIVESYERFSIFMRRFTVTGWRRGLVELLDDAATFGVAGTVLMLALALPAFEETKKDWRKEVDYSVTFQDRYGNPIGKRGILQNDSVPLQDIPDHMIKSLLATEDRRFFDHFGIDIIGTARAVVENLRHRGVTQGGSSLTQQLAKNLFLTNERSLERKIKEAFLALWLESNLTKREILKLYLDRAYMGGGTFGVAAASEFYFGKSVRDINLSEAAMLAGLFKAPTKYAPHVNLPNARARANEVLTNLVQAGFYTEGQVLAARRNPAKPVDRKRDYTPDYFLDYAFSKIDELDLPVHTLTVKSTIDIGLQKKAEEVVEGQLREVGQELNISQAAVVIMEPDGAVRAIVGGRDYGSSQFNRATDAKRQPGSSFKPYVYLSALVYGNYNPRSVVSDQPVCIGEWCPKNYGGRYSGRVNLTDAIARSLNSIPVQLAQQIGRERVAKFAQMFGLPLPDKPDWPFVIGAVEVRVIDQAVGYAAFANGGYKVEAMPIEQVLNGAGEVIWDRKKNGPAPKRIVAEDKVQQINQMMNAGVERGTGTRARLEGIPAAGKTGTTQSSRDAWFCGFTGNMVGVVWVGNDDYRPMEKVTGGVVPAPIWHDIMEYAHASIELKQGPGMPPPSRKADQGASVAAAGQGKPGLTEVAGGAERPKTLTTRAVGVLSEIEGLMRQASPAAVSPGSGQPGTGQPGTGQPGFGAAPGRQGALTPLDTRPGAPLRPVAGANEKAAAVRPVRAGIGRLTYVAGDAVRRGVETLVVAVR
ncbi:transglycosylase domain-containing protein [Prosthecomicrobium hirschii]|uniref:transglycosylase domain-containing protein n=1 Tax=Prosthecodimorpha hirschii TaxID=665126 RepID=UPI00221F73B4|nr:PBP1A family penicillin-binding protein [Prosthecomicrobium hirschii]